jgi:phosphatidate phosphatase APP1
MKQTDKLKAILHIRPNAEFVLVGDEIQWVDTKQAQPTEAEIEAGWVAYQTKVEADKQKAVSAKAALLERLGITAEEAKLLLS